MTDRFQSILAGLILLAGCAIIFIISGNKVNQYGMVDTLLSLPTSQALWETGHVYLDQYEGRAVLLDGTTLTAENMTWRTTEVGGRLVDFFPVGNAILVLPLTAILSQAGYDFVDPATNLGVQNRLSFLTGSVALLLIFALYRVWLPRWYSLLITFISFFGSIVFSTLGSAFWSINTTIIFNLLIVILLSLKANAKMPQKYESASSIIIGVLLFLGFFCRVSSVPVIVCTLILLAVMDRGAGVRAGTAALLLLALFSIWSSFEYGQLLPPYYALNRIDDAPVPLWVGLYGNLLSPSRGFFVYMSWLLVPLGLGIWKARIWKDSFVIYGLSWFVLQLLLVSQANIWWGGGSFGPRLLTEAMPAVFLIVALISKELVDADLRLAKPVEFAAGGLFIFLSLFSISQHSYQAFYNPYTHWFWYDAAPAVVAPPTEDLGPYFDWSIAQWRSNASIVCGMDRENFESVALPFESTLEPVALNQPITFLADKNQDWLDRAAREKAYGVKAAPVAPGEGNQALFEGMYVLRGDGRWSSCPISTVHFLAGDDLASDRVKMQLNITSLDEQEVEVELNGLRLESVPVQVAGGVYELEVPAGVLLKDQLNALRLRPNLTRNPERSKDGFDLPGPVGFKFTELVFVAP